LSGTNITRFFVPGQTFFSEMWIWARKRGSLIKIRAFSCGRVYL